MEAVNITRSAKLIRDSEGYWLVLQTSAGSGLFSLSDFIDLNTSERASITLSELLDAYLRAQKIPPRLVNNV